MWTVLQHNFSSLFFDIMFDTDLVWYLLDDSDSVSTMIIT
jgi:hypothetical protein